MIARAPGKVVLSGAYAVLEGSPAVVTAVSRYVVADTERAAELVTPEQREAFGDSPVPHFDASALRSGGRKLGLGSSAAIVVASLAAAHCAEHGVTTDSALRQAILDRALRAHAAAQGGGSGIDVAASCHGGTLLARRREGSLEVSAVRLPRALHLEVWAASEPASTPSLIASVRALRAAEPTRYEALLRALDGAATSAAESLARDDAQAFIAALAAQAQGLDDLGDAAHAPIVTGAVRALAGMARARGAVVMPAGAGGGDVAIYAGLEPPGADLLARAQSLGHEPLSLELDARGVHCSSS